MKIGIFFYKYVLLRHILGIMPGTLYIVPTPIGNLEDITLRALRVLKEVDYIAAEDKRVSIILLNHYEIAKPLSVLYQHNEHKKVEIIVQDLLAGKSVAVISDAGTPGISDPGFLIVRKAIEHGIHVECLPGATALIPALILSAFPTQPFIFCGFIPFKKGRTKIFKELATVPYTLVFYESPHRLEKTLGELALYLGNRQAVVARELTKKFETIHRGTLLELLEYFKKNSPRGECVIVVDRNEDLNTESHEPQED